MEYGILVSDSNNVCIETSNILQCLLNGIFVVGDCSTLILRKNIIDNNKDGIIFFEGNLKLSILEDNYISNNKGANNYSAGIVFHSVKEVDYNNIRKENNVDLNFQLCSPNNFIILNNTIQGNNAQGIYSEGGDCNYIIENRIYNNDKEGMCLDFATVGTTLLKILSLSMAEGKCKVRMN